MSWQQDAERHAQAEAPREACGLVVVVKGRSIYWPCRNTALGADQFSIDPGDYACAEDTGEIVAVVHSHPDATPDPSEADLVGCEASGLEWHIVGLPALVWRSIRPSGYRAPLVGRQFVHGVLDCYAIIRDWYRQERGGGTMTGGCAARISTARTSAQPASSPARSCTRVPCC